MAIWKLAALVVTAVVCVGLLGCKRHTVGSASAQQGSGNNEIGNANARPLISVSLEIHAKDAALVIPVCSGDEKTHFLCSGAAFLQVFSNGGWQPAVVRKGLLATLWRDPKDTWKAQRIDVGETANFDFTFSPDLLDVQRGEHLRLAVNSWTSEAAMRPKMILASG
jgi:hypothetical protein